MAVDVHIGIAHSTVLVRHSLSLTTLDGARHRVNHIEIPPQSAPRASKKSVLEIQTTIGTYVKVPRFPIPSRSMYSSLYSSLKDAKTYVRMGILRIPGTKKGRDRFDA